MVQDYQKTKIIWLLVIGIVCYAFFYVANIYLLKQLSLEEFGDFAFSIKVLAIMCAFLTVSKQLSLSLYMPQYEKSHRYIQKDGIALWLSKNLILSAIILITGVGLTWFVIYLVQSKTFVAVFKHHPWQFVLFFIPIITFFIVFSCLLLAQQKRVGFVAPFITIVPSMFVVMTFTLAIYTLNLPARFTLYTYLVCQTTIFILYLLLSHYYYTPNFLSHVSTDEHGEWYSSPQIYWVGTLSNQTATVLSLFALEYLSPEDFVGKYAIILLFVASYAALISPLHTYLASQLNLLISSDSEKLQKIIKLITKTQIIVVLFGISTSIAFGKELLQQIHPQVDFLYPQLVFAMTMFGLSIVTTVPLRIILHAASTDTGVYLKISRLLFSCILMSVLVPRYGITGAIISDTLPLITTNLIAYIICKRNLSLHLI